MDPLTAYQNDQASLRRGHRRALSRAGQRSPSSSPSATPSSTPSPMSQLGAIDYSNPLSPADLKTFLDATVRQKFGAQERGIQRTAKQLPAWYNDYRNALSTGKQLTQGATDAASNALMAQADSAQQNDSQAYGAMQATAQAGLPGGQQLDPGAAARAGQASAVDRADTDAFRNMLTVQGNASSNLYDHLSAISRGDQVQQRGKLHTAYNDLQQEKGDYAVTALHDLIDQERTYGLSKAAFGETVQQDANQYDLGLLGAQTAGTQAQTAAAKAKADAAAKKLDTDGDGSPDYLDPAPLTPGDVRPGQYDHSGKGKDGTLSPSEQRARNKLSVGVQGNVEDAIDAAFKVKNRDGVGTGKKALHGSALRDAIGTALLQGEYGKKKTDPITHAVTYGGKALPVWLVSAALDVAMTPDQHISKRNRIRVRSHADHYAPWLKKYLAAPTNDGYGSDRASG